MPDNLVIFYGAPYIANMEVPWYQILLWIVLAIIIVGTIIKLYLQYVEYKKSKQTTVGGHVYKDKTDEYGRRTIWIANPQGVTIETMSEIDNKVISYFYENVYRSDFMTEVRRESKPGYFDKLKFANETTEDTVSLDVLYLFYIHSKIMKDKYPKYGTGDTKFSKFGDYLKWTRFGDPAQTDLLVNLNNDNWCCKHLPKSQIETLLSDSSNYNLSESDKADLSALQEVLADPNNLKPNIRISLVGLKLNPFDGLTSSSESIKTDGFCSIM